MAPTDQQQRIERRVTAVLADAGLPLPDAVECDARCVRFLWHDAKLALVVDRTGFSERDADGDYTFEDAVP